MSWCGSVRGGVCTYFAALEYKSCCFGLPNAHNDRRETLHVRTRVHARMSGATTRECLTAARGGLRISYVFVQEQESIKMFTLGLYSEFLVFTVIFFKSRRVPKKTVLIVFLKAYSKEKQLMDESLTKKHKSKENTRRKPT